VDDRGRDADAERDAAGRVDRTIPYIEAHHHLWELDRFPYRWLAEPGTPGHNARLGDYKAIRVDWGPDRFYREFYGQNVIKSVHVEGDSGAPDPVQETTWLESIAKAHGYPNAIVVYCDIEKEGAEAALEHHLAASPRVRGVRIREHPDDPDSLPFRRGYAALGRHGLSYELNASPGKLISGRDVARSVPDVQVILGHAGFPIRRDPEYFELWSREISTLAEAENVACKISGLGMVDHDWSVESFRPWVLQCIDAFGVDRVMFGTNWPVDSLYAPYIEQVDAWRRIIAKAGFSRQDQEKLLYRNAEKFYAI
jgi:predicted TIM-barrel fold metal-dependent hydrolase